MGLACGDETKTGLLTKRARRKCGENVCPCRTVLICVVVVGMRMNFRLCSRDSSLLMGFDQ